MLEANDRELQRTQKLVEIGGASRQEMERIHAEHAAQTAAVESARSQLETARRIRLRGRCPRIRQTGRRYSALTRLTRAVGPVAV